MSSVFTIHTPEITLNKVVYSYSYFDEQRSFSFQEEHLFPIALVDSKSLRALAIATSISYFKLHLAKEIKVNWYLDEAEKSFWKWLFVNGFSELIYQNKLDWSVIENINIVGSHEIETKIPFQEVAYSDAALVGIGGGKDSSLAVELLKKMNLHVSGFATKVREIKLIQENATALSVPLLEVIRKPDPQLLTLKEGVFLGHIPISLVYALTGIVLAEQQKVAYVVVANETSADESNTLWQGKAVNHQWSKTSEFEKKFQGFVHATISPNITYFSILRPLGGLKVTNLFTEVCRHVLGDFSSCNKNFTIETNTAKKWCGVCPKCLGTNLLLSVSLPKEEILKIFGSTLDENESLENLLKELLGLSPIKPFDCVATREEMCIAVTLIPDFRSSKLGMTLSDSEWREVETVAKKAAHWLTDYNENFIPKEINSRLRDIIHI